MDTPVRQEPTSRERTWAGAMHLASILWPIVAPAVAFLGWRRSSLFVASHALQALFETIVLNVLLFIATVASLTYTLVTLWGHYQDGWQDFSVWPFLTRFAVGFVALGLLWVWNLVHSLRQALQAWRGVWPRQNRRLRKLAGAETA
jgi:hypothetical protein